MCRDDGILPLTLFTQFPTLLTMLREFALRFVQYFQLPIFFRIPVLFDLKIIDIH